CCEGGQAAGQGACANVFPPLYSSEDAMRKAGVAHSKSSKDMESHVFLKAKTRDEYLSLVARLIIHFRDIRKHTLCPADPMNALQSLTGGPAAGAAGLGLPARGPGQALGGMGGLGAMGQPVPLSGQPPPGASGMAPHSMAVVSTAAPQSEYTGGAGAVQPLPAGGGAWGAAWGPSLLILPQLQQQQLQRMAQLQLQQQQQQQQALQAQPPIQQPPLQQPPPPPSQALPQQLQPPQHHQAPPQPPPQAQPQPQPLVSQAPALPGQMLYTQPQLKLVRAPMVVQQPHVQPQVPPQTAVPTAQASQAVGPGVQVRAPRRGSGGTASARHPRPRSPARPARSPAPTSGRPGRGPPPPLAPAPPRLTRLLSASSGPAPSPSSFLPSPSPQPSQSPVTARTPQNFSVPSPGPLNTPVNPSSVMSPAGSSQAEEQQYLDKLKQLSKYIEPLRRMINKIDKNEDRKKDLSKMKSLLDILTDPSKRCPLKTLQKCEIALEKLKNDMAVPTPPPPPVPPTKQQYLCQPLLDAVLANIRSPVFNHSLYRTFVPAMTAIHGPPVTAPVVSTRKRKFEEDERQSIPNVLQGEVARLDPKFLVNLDPSHCSNDGAVHLICKLDDRDLPSVPPLELSVPADYPAQSPLWINRQWQYDANPFLQSVHRCMASRLLQLPDKHSVTALLNTWAQSVHQACLSAA
uniref:Mediator of RNA polymerase II transcription subunit 15 n=1 Tax=Capra hircus TaxID=9925 RepID=A0A452DJY7_CAPHI